MRCQISPGSDKLRQTSVCLQNISGYSLCRSGEGFQLRKYILNVNVVVFGVEKPYAGSNTPIQDAS